MVLPVLVISAFMNNSPVVLVLIPIITSWSRKAGLAPGHLFMPLSFASILGGTITLIGTSTNLVVAGKQRESFPDDPPITMFDLSPYGVPVALAGIIYIILLAPRLLPGKAKKAAGYVSMSTRSTPCMLLEVEPVAIAVSMECSDLVVCNRLVPLSAGLLD